MKLKKRLTKQEKAVEKRFNKLWRKRHLTEAEDAELKAILRMTLREYPELFVQLPDGRWWVTEEGKQVAEATKSMLVNPKATRQ